MILPLIRVTVPVNPVILAFRGFSTKDRETGGIIVPRLLLEPTLSLCRPLFSGRDVHLYIPLLPLRPSDTGFSGTDSSFNRTIYSFFY